MNDQWKRKGPSHGRLNANDTSKVAFVLLRDCLAHGWGGGTGRGGGICIFILIFLRPGSSDVALPLEHALAFGMFLCETQ